MQYGYKPASKSLSLTVALEKTDVVDPDKTPEEMQQQAEQGGWLTIWHEFTWEYPWYRLHVATTIGGLDVDVGFNPLFFGGENLFLP